MFRSFLYNNFLNKLVSSDKQYINYFQIGCYPCCDDNINHEFPNSLKTTFDPFSFM